MVERVECLPAKLNLISFLNAPVLNHGQIRGADRRFLDDEFLRVSRGSVSVVRECGRIQVRVNPVPLAPLSHAQGLSRNLVRAILADQEPRVIVALSPVYSERGSGLRGVK